MDIHESSELGRFTHLMVHDGNLPPDFFKNTSLAELVTYSFKESLYDETREEVCKEIMSRLRAKKSTKTQIFKFLLENNYFPPWHKKTLEPLAKLLFKEENFYQALAVGMKHLTPMEIFDLLYDEHYFQSENILHAINLIECFAPETRFDIWEFVLDYTEKHQKQYKALRRYAFAHRLVERNTSGYIIKLLPRKHAA